MIQKVFSKKITSMLLTLMIVVFGTIVLKMSVFATEEPKIADSCVPGQPVQLEISEYRSDKATLDGVEYYTKTPEQEGMIFAGWFQDEACKNPVSDTTVSGTYWAKFVPEHILTVKGQVSKEAYTKEDTEYRDLRVVTTVDSLWYNKVGFQMEINGKSKHIFSNTVYTQIRAVGDKEGEYIDYTPSGEFCALSSYFKTWTFTGIPKDAWDTVICAMPFWVTMDGTIVYGEKGEKSVNQGLSDNPDLRPYVAQIGDSFYETLGDAVKAVTSSDVTEIILLKDIEIDSMVAWANDKNIVLTNKEGTVVTLSRTTGYTANMFRIATGSLKIQGVDVDGEKGIVIDGKGIQEDENGSAAQQLILSTVNLTLQGVTIKDAYGSAGGAIRMNSGTLHMEDCNLQNICSTNIGGAILLDGTSNSNIARTKFVNNQSTTVKSGGALYVRGSGSHQISASKFDGNVSTQDGGAIYATGTAALTVSGTTFNTNGATRNGGAIFNSSTGDVTITECNFTNNKASKMDGATVGQGGAVYCSGGQDGTEVPYTVLITTCTFESNEAYNHGGALRAGGFYGTYTVKNCNFMNNTAGVTDAANGNGGAIYATDGAKVSVLADAGTNYTFDGNVASRGTSGLLWGAIDNNSSQTMIYSDNYNYKNNTDGTVSDTGAGVGAHTAGNERTLIKVDVEVSNYSELQTAINDATTNTATQITLLNNMESSSLTTLSAGQHIILTNKAGTPVTITRGTTHKARLFAVTSGSLTIEGAEADGKSGIVIDANKVVGTNQLLYANGGDITIKNATIQDAYGSVGAAIRMDSGTLTIDNCLIKGSQGSNATGGGAIFLDNAATSNISNTTFNNNTTAGSGGAIFIRGTGTHTIKNCNFIENQAAKNGGAIYAMDSSTVSVLVDGTETYAFTNNTATGTGCTAGYIWGAIANASSNPLQYSTAYTYSDNTDGTVGTVGTGVGPGNATSSVTEVSAGIEE